MIKTEIIPKELILSTRQEIDELTQQGFTKSEAIEILKIYTMNDIFTQLNELNLSVSDIYSLLCNMSGEVKSDTDDISYLRIADIGEY